MRLALKPHPDSPPSAARDIEVAVERSTPGVLALTYVVTGRIAELALPPPAAAQRTNELWRRTCFEAFLRAPGGEAYFEFNLAPSSEWAAYCFTGYRSGMRPVAIPPPRIELDLTETRLELRATLRLAETDWRLGLSAVIEGADGGVSYWALAHPPGRADFHHADCFAAELRAPQRP